MSSCSTCHRWVKTDDPLGSTGECRLEPKHHVLPSADGEFRHMAVFYLVTSADFPACSYYLQPLTAEALNSDVDRCQEVVLRRLAEHHRSSSAWLALAYEWLADHQKWPRLCLDGTWVWAHLISPAPSSTGGLESYLLPAPVEKAITGRFTTASSALQAAAQSLATWLESKAS